MATPPRGHGNSSSEKPALYGTVALALPFKFHTGGVDGLTYAIPADLIDRAQPGTRVLVPLGKREMTGVLVATSELSPSIEQKIKPIVDILDAVPVFDLAFLDWTKWIAQYYMTSWGDVLTAALPEGLKPETKSRVYPGEGDIKRHIDQIRARAPRRADVLEVIARHPEGITIDRLEKELSSKSLYHAMHSLEEQGLVRMERPLSSQAKIKMETVVSLPSELKVGSDELSNALAELEKQAPRQANILLAIVQQMQMAPSEPLTLPLLLKKAGAAQSTFKSLRDRGLVTLTQREKGAFAAKGLPSVTTDEDISNIMLTAEQQSAVGRINEQLNLGLPRTFLLHGITGSGKTEVYIALAKRVLAEGNGVLILVPEIALTPQLIERFKKRLSIESDDEIAVLHSRMSVNERFAAWRSLSTGRTRIAIGARSAVFAPIERLKLIIVDEEHEATYKQYDKTPRYNARDIAVVRASMLKGVCILGSATPSVESYHNAREGKYQLIKLTQRAKQAQLPEVKIVDLRTAQNRSDFARVKIALTPVMRDAMKERMEKNEGIVLFQNRRGFSTYLECTACGTPEMCPNCSVTMTYHRPKNNMRCHYCGFFSPKRTTCATCGSEELRLGGLGTQRVEDDILKAFPEARILRMDLDTTAKKGAYKKILTTFATGNADILLGTQMVAKGLDFPRVTLVGVVSADTSLCLPDFRAGERTFQLLTQVSGRAGRSLELAGEVLIQTLQPEHPSIAMAVAHNYDAFFEREMDDRAKLMYPPYSRLILIEFKGLREDAVRERAEIFASLFPEKASFYERMGPAPPTIAKLRNEYRWHLLIKDYKHNDPNGEKVRRLITGALEQYQKRFASNIVKVTVDVDVQGVT